MSLDNVEGRRSGLSDREKKNKAINVAKGKTLKEWLFNRQAFEEGVSEDILKQVLYRMNGLSLLQDELG